MTSPRRASLAMPFLITVASAAHAQGQALPHGEAPLPPTKEPGSDTPQAPSLSPPAAPKARPTQIKPVEVKSVKIDGGTITRRADGTCWQSVTVRCPEGVLCNPPPPQPVACPSALSLGLPTYVKDGDDTIVRRPDGRCERMIHVRCREGFTCNPPPPQPATCPDALLPPHMRGQKTP